MFYYNYFNAIYMQMFFRYDLEKSVADCIQCKYLIKHAFKPVLKIG